ncbi:hypothetical protein Tco_1435039, partial [Tanacetum coccineum]
MPTLINTYNNVCQIVMDHSKGKKKHAWFDEHELMDDDDDDIGDLEDYLIQKDPLYYVNEEEERSKEKRCKLLGIPYVKPPTCKTEKFEVVKYSFGPAEEYVTVMEYEYGIRSQYDVSWFTDTAYRHPVPFQDLTKRTDEFGGMLIFWN